MHCLFCAEDRLATADEMDRIRARREGQAYLGPAGGVGRASRPPHGVATWSESPGYTDELTAAGNQW
jgi:hypothetical protein